VTEAFGYLSPAQRELFSTHRQAASLRRLRVQSGDGHQLAVFTVGAAHLPPVVLLNPLGVSCLFFMNLVAELQARYRIVTWETRGLPEYDHEPAAEGHWSPECHARDLVAVLEACQARHPAAIISYCSGSYLGLFALARSIVPAPSRLVLVSPPLELSDAGERTLYQRTFPGLLARIARSGPGMGAVVRRIMLQAGQESASGVTKELHVLNSLPFATNDSIYRYACLHAAWSELPWRELLAQVRSPTRVLHAAEDPIVHTDTVRALVQALPNAELRVYPAQDHFAVYNCRELIRDAVRFVDAGGMA
jgi:pimeloyl-ACP methyl ester carboxylesterase